MYSWIVTLPIQKYKFSFQDTLYLSYGWKPSLLLSSCVCIVIHSLLIMPWIATWEVPPQFIIMRLGTSLPTSQRSIYVMVYVWSLPCAGFFWRNIVIINTTANRDDSAQLNIRALGFWGLPQQQAFFSMWESIILTHLHTVVLNCQLNCYRRHEWEKQRAYEQCVREIEHGPLLSLFSVLRGYCNDHIQVPFLNDYN